MAIANHSQLASAGFAGALTSVVAEASDRLFPDGKWQVLVTLVVAMIVSLVTFEIMSWFVVFRLKRSQKVLKRVLAEFSVLKSDIDIFLSHQVETMKANNASKSALAAAETEDNRTAQSIIELMSAITRQNADIIKQLAS